jgi:glycosyltransferase involved in cell wall biosynthesis
LKDIKIAFFVSGLRPGGIGRYVLNLAKGFVKRGFHVDIILPKEVEAYHHYIPEKANVINLKTGRTLKSVIPLIRYLKQNKPYALISANDYVNIAAIWASKVAKVNTKIISTIHTDRRNVEKNSSVKEFLFNKLARVTYPLSDYIVAVSAGVSENSSKIYKIPRPLVNVIHNPILDDSLQEKMNDQVKHKWFIKRNQKVILGVGRLTKQKDFSILIEAFKIVRENRPVKLIVLGEGAERIRLQELIKEYGFDEDVDLPGFVENPYSYMKCADLLVLSSRYEGFGNVIVEAMAAGTPVVSTNCPSGPAEILENGKFGYLVPVGNVTLLAEAIEKALDEPANSEALKTRAMDFSIDKITEDYARLLKLL